MAITADLTTAIGQIRLEIGDDKETSGARPGDTNFADEELAHFYTVEGGDISIDPVQKYVGRASAKACETLAVMYANEPTATKTGPTSDRVNASVFYGDMGKRLRSQYGGDYLDGRAQTRLPFPSGTARLIVTPYGAYA